MGCGISTLDSEDVSSRRRSNRGSNHVIAPPVVDNKKVDHDNDGYGGVAVGNELEAKTKEEGFKINEDKLKEKSVADQKEKESTVALNNENRGNIIIASHIRDDDDDDKHVKNGEEENNEDIDDRVIGPGSPSFREYCTDFDSVDQSSMGESNDCDSAGESSKNFSSSDDDHSTNKLRKEKTEDSTKQESEKRVRIGRGFRNAMNKGKARRKKNLLNFACYNSSTQSYAEGSFQKIVEKTA